MYSSPGWFVTYQLTPLEVPLTMADSTIEHKGKVRCVTRSRASSQENEPFVCHSLDDADRDLRPYPSFTTFTLIVSVILSISALFMLGLWMESGGLHVDQTWEIRRVSTDCMCVPAARVV
jgi:hypothetical protein